MYTSAFLLTIHQKNLLVLFNDHTLQFCIDIINLIDYYMENLNSNDQFCAQRTKKLLDFDVEK